MWKPTGAAGLFERLGPGRPRGSDVCLPLQVKINSRGLVYSVVLLLGSVGLTVSVHAPETEAPPRLHFPGLCPVTHRPPHLSLPPPTVRNKAEETCQFRYPQDVGPHHCTVLSDRKVPGGGEGLSSLLAAQSSPLPGSPARLSWQMGAVVRPRDWHVVKLRSPYSMRPRLGSTLSLC